MSDDPAALLPDPRAFPSGRHPFGSLQQLSKSREPLPVQSNFPFWKIQFHENRAALFARCSATSNNEGGKALPRSDSASRPTDRSTSLPVRPSTLDSVDSAEFDVGAPGRRSGLVGNLVSCCPGGTGLRGEQEGGG